MVVATPGGHATIAGPGNVRLCVVQTKANKKCGERMREGGGVRGRKNKQEDLTV